MLVCQIIAEDVQNNSSKIELFQQVNVIKISKEKKME